MPVDLVTALRTAGDVVGMKRDGVGDQQVGPGSSGAVGHSQVIAAQFMDSGLGSCLRTVKPLPGGITAPR